MQKNVGTLDRFYRFGIGFFSFALAVFTDSMFLKVLFAVVALVGLATAASGYCPLNAKFGVNTTKRKTK